MTAFHSDNALDKLKKLPVVRGKDAVEPNVVTKNFRAFRKELVSKTLFFFFFFLKGGGEGKSFCFV